MWQIHKGITKTFLIVVWIKGNFFLVHVMKAGGEGVEVELHSSLTFLNPYPANVENMVNS
jgi:hypothetical protein